MNLINNSKEMKTEVETFVIEETAELIYDNEKLNKWNTLVEECGLKGQTKIVKPEKSPIPFMHLKTSMKNVFECLCPRKVNVEDYDVTPIPVEILDLIALSKRENYFPRIEIWYDEKSPDPACVGVTSSFYIHGYTGVPKELNGKTFDSKDVALDEIKKINPDYNDNCFGWEVNINQYLLGKWADVKHSFEELKEMATKRHIEQEGNKLRQIIKDTQRELDDLETKAFEQFN